MARNTSLLLQLRSRAAEAEEVLREVLAWSPFLPEAHAERAKMLAAGGKWEKAVEEAGFVLRNAGEQLWNCCARRTCCWREPITA